MGIGGGRLPHGVVDLFGEEAARHIMLRKQIRTVFASWGYQEIIPPTFEYADIHATDLSPRLQEEVYRFVDREGHMLALRADFTLAVARIVGARLHDWPHPLRLCYVGRVFRHDEPRLAQPREFTQAGVELIGSDSIEADVELIALAINSLRATGLDHFQINVGHSGWLRSLLATQAMPDALVDSITSAIDRKQRAALDRLVSPLSLSRAVKQALLETPYLTGGQEALHHARNLAASDEAEAVVERLTLIADVLVRRGLFDHVAFDLGEARGLGYYTGITFEMFAPSIGVSLGAGGRYDGLLSHFGPDLPAVGYALTLERLLLALKEAHAPAVSILPDVVAAYPPTVVASSLIQQARALGWRIEEDLEGRHDEALLRHARRRGAREIWFWESNDMVCIVTNGARRMLSVHAMANELSNASRG